MSDLSRGNGQNRGRGRVANVHSAFREFSGGTPKKAFAVLISVMASSDCAISHCYNSYY